MFLLGIAVLRQTDRAVSHLMMCPKIPVGDFAIKVVGESVGAKSFLPRFMQADKIGNTKIGVQVGKYEVIQNFEMRSNRITGVDVFNQGDFFEHVLVLVTLVQTAMDNAN